MGNPNIIAFSGTHGTGKTTSVYDYAAKSKKTNSGNVGVLLEVARSCPYPIMSQTCAMSSEAAQSWIFGKQLYLEAAMSYQYDWVISDRTIVDCIAYTIHCGHISLADAMMGMARQLMHRYTHIFFKPLASNPYCKPDGTRSTDMATRQNVEQILLSLYQELGVSVCMDNSGRPPHSRNYHPGCRPDE